MAHQIALIAIPTLDIVAAGVPCFDGALIATLQAGRGRLCAQRYGWQDDGWTPAGEAAITTWSHLIAAVERDTLFAGEIDDAGRALLETIYRPARIAPAAHCLRRAGFLAEMAWMRLKTGHLDDPARVTPIYLHQPGAPHP
jgi:tRNA threonylcarbamoyladenosine biosynthesis protein TsaB